ncbi:MAG: LysM peptidoglycan-binding domain-containing protein [Candidatus Promineifilaceae bacterium]|jgi:LysM repeat protein
MFDRTDGKVLILIMFMAVILALGGALAYFYLQGRPEYPPGTYVADVNNTKVLVRSNPKMAVQIIATPPEQQLIAEPPAQQGGQGGQVQDPTPVPVPTLPPEPTPVPVPTLVPTAAPALCIIFIDYVVEPGDTLYSISMRFNTTIALMARFGLDATDIVPGTQIRLPIADESCCPNGQAYVVREGDTLTKIAIKCNTTVDTLKQINGFGELYRLDETSVICVPPQPQG